MSNSLGQREKPVWQGISQSLIYERGQAESAALNVKWELEATAGVTPSHPAIALNQLIGHRLRIETAAGVQCGNCGAASRKSFGQGYCYPCFRKLARCDLCMMAPTRCHFAAGTCREPQWAETFCFSGHVVYLAVSSGLKVGITRQGREFGRWTNQGAVQAMVMLHTDTRQLAGQLEVELAEQISDRSQWQRLVSEHPDVVDLVASQRALLAQRERDFGPLPAGARLAASNPIELAYPTIAMAPATQIKLSPNTAQDITLVGVRGQYLLTTQGALHVGRLRGSRIQIGDLGRQDDADLQIESSVPKPTDSQLELF